MRPLRFGIIGCADIARRRVLPAMSAAADIEIAAVASRSPARAAHLAGQYGARPVTGYAELLADTTVDAVYLPLPTALHARWIEAALLAGKHVLAEKPLTTDPARTRQLLALAGSRGLVLRENVMFVHHRQHAVVRDLLADGAIGELRALHAAFAIPVLAEGNIRYDPRLGGGALWDVGVYPVRAVVHFLGGDLRVAGAVLNAAPGRQVDTAGAALLHRGDRVVAQLSFGFEHAYRSSYELWGSAGRITVNHAFTPPADHHPLITVDRPAGSKVLRLDPDDQVVATLAAFTTAVHSGQSCPDQDSLHQADLLDAVRRSAYRQDTSAYHQDTERGQSCR